MTNEQFEALKQWISRRSAISRMVDAHPADSSRMNMLRNELQQADEEARSVLVDPQPLDEIDLI